MTANFEIVFVHLGDARAKHLWANIKGIQSIWPHVPITLVSDANENLERASHLGINTFEFKTNLDLNRAIESSGHDSNFRQGFWNYSILRLFAVLQYSESKPDLPLIHLESDIAILPNFPLEKLANLKKPSWMKFNETHDVGSIFTVPNATFSQFLTLKLLEIISKNRNLTDMTLLSKFAEQHPSSMTYLPVSSSTQDSALRGDLRGSVEAEKTVENFQLFGGIFDSAPLGMWLLGQDPRNHLGRLLRYRALPESYIQAQTLKFEFDHELIALTTSAQVQVFNLHVHSKELKYFKSMRWYAIGRRVKKSRSSQGRVSFSFRAFYQLTLDFYKRNGVRTIPNKILSLIKTLI
jgi:hypothetical protein